MIFHSFICLLLLVEVPMLTTEVSRVNSIEKMTITEFDS
jgi:hypothetical protein